MDHDTKLRFRITFGFLSLTKPIFNRSLEVVFFNFSRDIRGIVGGLPIEGYSISNGEISRKEKRISYFSKGLKLKTVSALNKSFWFALNLFIALPPTFLKVARTKKQYS